MMMFLKIVHVILVVFASLFLFLTVLQLLYNWRKIFDVMQKERSLVKGFVAVWKLGVRELYLALVLFMFVTISPRIEELPIIKKITISLPHHEVRISGQVQERGHGCPRDPGGGEDDLEGHR